MAGWREYRGRRYPPARHANLICPLSHAPGRSAPSGRVPRVRTGETRARRNPLPERTRRPDLGRHPPLGPAADVRVREGPDSRAGRASEGLRPLREGLVSRPPRRSRPTPRSSPAWSRGATGSSTTRATGSPRGTRRSPSCSRRRATPRAGRSRRPSSGRRAVSAGVSISTTSGSRDRAPFRCSISWSVPGTKQPGSSSAGSGRTLHAPSSPSSTRTSPTRPTSRPSRSEAGYRRPLRRRGGSRGRGRGCVPRRAEARGSTRRRSSSSSRTTARGSVTTARSSTASFSTARRSRCRSSSSCQVRPSPERPSALPSSSRTSSRRSAAFSGVGVSEPPRTVSLVALLSRPEPRLPAAASSRRTSPARSGSGGASSRSRTSGEAPVRTRPRGRSSTTSRTTRGDGEPGLPEAARAPRDDRRDGAAPDGPSCARGGRPGEGEEAAGPRLPDRDA